LADQVTPLRLAGHLSVLVVGAIILMLSQMQLPEWNISLGTLPNDALGAAVAQPIDLQSQQTGEAATTETASDVLQRSVVPFTVAKVEEVTRAEIEVYTVKAGDTVLGIAAAYGLQPETIMWANSQIEQNPDRLSIGDPVNILPVDGVLHVVKPGDTLSSLAAKYKVDVNNILGYPENGLADATAALTVGSQLVIPGGTKPFITPQVPAGVVVEAPSDATKGSGSFSWPISGNITQQFWGGHRALDIGSWVGAPAKAADSGYVILAGGGWNGGYGNHVIIDHGNGFTTLYAHLNSIFVRTGESVSRGQQIGTVGTTGNSTGPHLHFEIRYQGSPRNPYNWLP
jgi:murein DD-endopeptidase MepM/ murein hydrolase activator NlpD